MFSWLPTHTIKVIGIQGVVERKCLEGWPVRVNWKIYEIKYQTHKNSFN